MIGFSFFFSRLSDNYRRDNDDTTTTKHTLPPVSVRAAAGAAAVRARSARWPRDVSDSPSRRKHQTWPSYRYTLVECVPS